jgi:hypothetical protein
MVRPSHVWVEQIEISWLLNVHVDFTRYFSRAISSPGTLRLQPKNALSRQTSGAMLLADRGYDELSANTMLG